MITGVGSTVVGVAITATTMLFGLVAWPVGLLVGWAMALHGLRNLRMMVFHQSAHRNMWRRRRPDRTLGRILAAVLVVQNFDAYAAEHVTDHHAAHHMTLRDPTVQAILLGLGLRPGMSRRAMWGTLLGKLVSPVFHARFLTARVRSYWIGVSRAERITLTAAYAAVITLAALTGTLPVLLVAWVVPLTVLFQISNTLRLCVKHTFPAPGTTTTGREYFAGLTNAIFLSSPPPAADEPGPRRLAGWIRWWATTLTVHFPSRYLVLTGDTVCHDFHHRYPMTKEWPDYVFARQRDLERGHPGWPPYTAAWGLRAAIDRVFDSLRAADPAVFRPERVDGVNRRQVFAAFDD
ncbi:fatty acid desaturase [Actinokineospora alba]|uniref:fatty acid desaturase n=1 Tax=Actinokineospora alba TaxID=504798 RepID=UPI001E454FDE|nr:fatty acid desaturase [Actinokineospora alba]